MVKAGGQGSFVFFIISFLICAASTLLVFWGTQKELTKIGVTAKPQTAFDSKVSNRTSMPQTATGDVLKEVQEQKGEVTRRTHVERGSDVIESVFLKGHQEIARQTVAKDGKVTQSGRIPDGLVKFYDDFNNTYGEEHYRYNRKHGIVKTFYYDGQLKSEEKFGDGTLILSKEYYNTGVLRLEVNYENASDFFDQTEIGVGKLYFPSGVLKYEWSFTKNSKFHFRKAYHRNGQLRVETYYDQDGNVTKDIENQ